MDPRGGKMRKSRFTEEQIAHALAQAQAGVPVKELCRKYGVSEATFYTWRKIRDADSQRAEATQAARGREPQAEAAGGGPGAGQADPAGRRPGENLKPARQRELVRKIRERYATSERRTCRLIRFSRSSHQYPSTRANPWRFAIAFASWR